MLQEFVHAFEERLRSASSRFNGRCSLEDNDSVGKISGHDEIVLDDESSLLGMHNEPLDHFGAHHTLLRVQIGRGLVDQIDVCRLAETKSHGGTLQLSTGQVLDLLVDNVVDAKRFHDIGNELWMNVRIADLVVQKLANRAFRFGRNLLRLVADVELRNFS